jgi:DNA-directed RNA polymerase subunit N (RpoN/RPB10)
LRREKTARFCYAVLFGYINPKGLYSQKIESKTNINRKHNYITLLYKMIIPVKCVTCGKVLANKYRYYLEQVRKKKLDKMGSGEDSGSIQKTVYLTKDSTAKTAEGEVLDDLGLFDPCCRRHFLTHVDIE